MPRNHTGEKQTALPLHGLRRFRAESKFAKFLVLAMRQMSRPQGLNEFYAGQACKKQLHRVSERGQALSGDLWSDCPLVSQTDNRIVRTRRDPSLWLFQPTFQNTCTIRWAMNTAEKRLWLIRNTLNG